MSRFAIFILSACVLTIFSCKENEIALDQSSNAISDYTKDIEYLASDALEGREVGTQGEILASKYIATRYKEVGLRAEGDDNTYFQHFTVKQKSNPHADEAAEDDPEIKGRNVVGYIDNKAATTVVIGAHYDHLGYGDSGSLHRGEKAIHNGADDNASGITAIIELAKRLKASELKNNNYKFVAFTGEEKGLWGSKHYVENQNENAKPINYMLNLDMVGRLKENKLMLNGTGTSSEWDEIIDECNTTSINLIKKESGMGPSDFASFYNKDIPVLSFFTGQHKDYHKPSDDPEFINYEGIESVVDLIERIIAEGDDEGKFDFVKTKDESARSGGFKVTLGVIPDYMYQGKGMRIDGVSGGKVAEKAGIVTGDIVVKMGEHEVIDMQTYMDALNEFEPGASTNVVVKREGKEVIKEVTFD